MSFLPVTTRIRLRIKLVKLRHRFARGERALQTGVHFAKRRPLRATAPAVMAIVGIGMALIMVFSSAGVASAVTVNLTEDDVLEGDAAFGEIARNDTELQLQQGVVGSWSNHTGVQNLPSLSYGTTNLVYGPNNTIYFMTSMASQCHFEKYDVERQTWEDLRTPPVGCGTGNLLNFDGTSSIYYAPGSNTGKFFRYDIPTDTWQERASAPTDIGDLSSAEFVSQGSNRYLYMFRGNSSPSFWRYSVGADHWDTMTPFPTSSNVNNGIATAWDGADSIFALANDRSEFRRYSIGTNSWTTLPNVSNGCMRNALQYANGEIFTVRLQWCNDRASFRSYNVAGNSWADLAPPPVPSNRYDFPPPVTFDGTRYMYTMLGSELRPEIYRYDTISHSWDESSLFPPDQDDAAYRQGLVYDGAASVYYVGGTYSSHYDRMYKYDLSTKQTTRIGSQINTRSGFNGVHHAGSLYMLPYQGDSYFQKYDVATDNWTALAPLPFASTTGADILDGGDGYLYAVLGGGNRFYRYNIVANTWSALTPVPTSVSSGGAIARVGTKIYVLIGNQSGFMAQYDMSAGTWSWIQGMPQGAIDHGGFLTGDKTRYLYLGTSSRTPVTARKVYRYDTQTGEFQRIADLPAVAKPYANAFYDTVNSKLFVGQGQASSRIWEWAPGTTSYVTTGTWFSKTMDLTQVQSWQPIEATIGGIGTTAIYTRTSPNGRIWTAWSATSGLNITSPVNRYLQMKVVLSGDGSNTPTIRDIAVKHTQETVAPSLPSQFNAFAEKGGAALTTGQSYEYRHPYFAWQAASDGSNGAGVEGYYVYYGINSAANPVTDGNFQANTDYTVTSPMTAGEIYYLRIAVKDRLGNISAGTTFFSYRYFYVSPPGEKVQTSTADFSAGVNTNMSVSGGSMSLVQQPNGAWSTGPMTMLPDRVRGAASVVVGDYLYVAKGFGTTTFWRYNLVSNVWENRSPTPGRVNIGSSVAHDGGNFLYLMAGENTNAFFKYDILNDTWTTLVNLPSNAQQGSDIVHLGNNQYAIMFTGVREFYFYNSLTNQFTGKQSYPVSISDAGSGLWYDGGDNVYGYLGGANWWNERSRPTMVRYSILNDTWKVLSNPPVVATYSQNNLVSDGQGNLYIFTNNNSDNLDRDQRAMRYEIATDTWHEVRGLNSNVTWGSASSDGKRYIYILPSEDADTRKIVRYDTWDKRFSPTSQGVDKYDRIPWDTHTNAWAWQAGNATTAVYDGSKYVYAFGGNEQWNHWTRFVKFDPKTGETAYLPPPPSTGVSGALGYLNGDLYYLPGRSTREFYRFDENTHKWSRMADLPLTSYRAGASNLVAVGGSLYALRGNSTNFYQYTPDSGLGVWTPRNPTPGNVQNGALAYDEANGHIYVVAGNNGNAFYRYSTALGSWSPMPAMPATSQYGAAMVLDNGKLYVQRGNGTATSYIFDIAANSWSTGVEAPEVFRYGSVMLDVGDHALALSGQGGVDFWQFNFPGPSRAYRGAGLHVSQPFEVPGIFDYAGISAQATIPENTDVELWTRTSSDGITWDEWLIATDVKVSPTKISGRVASANKKHIQVKVALSSFDNVSTPTVDSYSIHHYFDIDPPSNPGSLTSYSNATKDTVLTNNVWYNHPTPVFDWPEPGQPGGPTDGPLGSRISGYWVYVGTDPTASPRTAGVFVPVSEYSPSLTIPGSYYVRMQTQDFAGNVDGSVFSPFIYKFDNQYPTTPTLISANPSGYTTFNNFSFTWPNAFDAHSGIAGYCYHSGATSGAFAVETCQTGTTLNNVSAAYTSGANVMYVRTYDHAGNFSVGYTSVSYYYSTDPPGKVTNLKAIPPSSPENMFSFVWDLPAVFSGDPDQLTYCYSINALPNPLNTTCTPERYIAPFKAATQQGSNVIYMVAKDEANNAEWTSFAFTNFIANTVSPGIPLNLVATDTSDRASSRWSITTMWDTPEFAGTGIAKYIVERSENGHQFSEIGATSAKAFVDLGVTPNTTYSYRVRAADGVDNRGGPSGIVAMAARGSYSEPPALIVAPLASPDSTQARITWATSRPATSFVYYGTTPADLSQSKGSLDLATAQVQLLTGLQPSTTYFYRVQSFDNDRTYQLRDAYSPIFTFRTSEAARMYNVNSDAATMNSVMLSWQSSVPTRARVEYGTSLQYGLSADGSIDFTSTHGFKLSGLDGGTRYHYRIVATTEFGTTIYSDDYTFDTLARPIVTGVQFQAIDAEATAAVEVVWQTNVPTSSTVKYSGVGVDLEVTKSDLTTSHSVIIRDLASSSDYSFTVEGRDQYGNLAASSRQAWRSSVDTRPPNLSDISISVTTVSGSGGPRAQMIVVWKTDEPATTQVEYGTLASGKLDKSTPLDTEPTTNHIAIISDLNLADIYQVRFSSKDLSGNTVYSTKTLVVTPDKEESLLDSTLNLLLKVFRF